MCKGSCFVSIFVQSSFHFACFYIHSLRIVRITEVSFMSVLSVVLSSWGWNSVFSLVKPQILSYFIQSKAIFSWYVIQFWIPWSDFQNFWDHYYQKKVKKEFKASMLVNSDISKVLQSFMYKDMTFFGFLSKIFF